ncbi:achaete-scute homolog 4 [Electrophorus electricus]|uniref:BHLH domain-containing protein n=1 Tax=Electrophorus electricus TaxID=8005 RepID=A0A4W4H6B7_ELEEL|nr:achaete-scute homolog 4 [Electrophorus electricus]
MATEPSQGLVEQGSYPQRLAFGLSLGYQRSLFEDALSLPLHFKQPYLEPACGHSYGGHLSCLPFPEHLATYNCSFEPAFIRKRNERERQRVRCVNEGYTRLREHLPQGCEDKRLSKVETLRAAISYIKHLQNLLEFRLPDTMVSTSPGRDRRIEDSTGLSECNSDGESKHSLSDNGDPCY